MRSLDKENAEVSASLAVESQSNIVDVDVDEADTSELNSARSTHTPDTSNVRAQQGTDIQPLLRFISLVSGDIKSALDRSAPCKKLVDHRKYLQKQLKHFSSDVTVPRCDYEGPKPTNNALNNALNNVLNDVTSGEYTDQPNDGKILHQSSSGECYSRIEDSLPHVIGERRIMSTWDTDRSLLPVPPISPNQHGNDTKDSQVNTTTVPLRHRQLPASFWKEPAPRSHAGASTSSDCVNPSIAYLKDVYMASLFPMTHHASTFYGVPDLPTKLIESSLANQIKDQHFQRSMEYTQSRYFPLALTYQNLPLTSFGWSKSLEQSHPELRTPYSAPYSRVWNESATSSRCDSHHMTRSDRLMKPNVLRPAPTRLLPSRRFHPFS